MKTELDSINNFFLNTLKYIMEHANILRHPGFARAPVFECLKGKHLGNKVFTT